MFKLVGALASGPMDLGSWRGRWGRVWLAAAAVMLVSLSARVATAGCRSDADCKAGRVCRQGECEQPDSASPAERTDTVFMKGGGRVRGQVMVEEPGVGVSIKLPDGSVRQVPIASIERVEYAGGTSQGPSAGPTPTPPPDSASPPPAAPPTTGKIVLTAKAPGKVLLDSQEIGRVTGSTAITINNVLPGEHEVTVEYDAGGSRSDSVDVVAGAGVRLTLEPPKFEPSVLDQVAVFREGARFGLGAAAIFDFGLGDDTPGGGGLVEGLLNVGLAPEVDFRVAVDVAFESIEGVWKFGGPRSSPNAVSYCADPLWIESGKSYGAAAAIAPSVVPSLRFNLGSVYSMVVGFRLGLSVLPFAGDYIETICYTPRSSVLAVVGPEWSVGSFRFGEKREFELELWQGILVPVEPRATAYHMGLSFRYLFLGDAEEEGEAASPAARVVSWQPLSL
jgi:hypothetical protein